MIGKPLHCLMWANENWSRRWDGSEAEVLIAQDHRPEDEPALVDCFARHFADPRYIRVQGRPLLMVYRAGLIPDAEAAVARWRGLFRDRHGEDPLLVMAQSFGERDPRPLGMDGAVEFPPHKLTEKLRPLNAGLSVLDPGFTAQVYAYEDAVAASLAEAPPDYPLIRAALPGWDNDARRQGRGMVLHGATPDRYQAWLSALVRQAQRHGFFGESFVCINAWNEWAEGAALEPDQHFGAAFLNATSRAVAGVSAPPFWGRLLLVGHDAFPAGAQRLLLALAGKLRAAHGVEVALLLLDGGALEAAFEAAAKLRIARDGEDLAAAAAEFHAAGFRAALVNSAAAARAVPVLEAAGIVCTLLVHELPRLLEEKGLTETAAQGAGMARRVVFAHEAVRDPFLALTGLPAARTAIRPQGAYAPVRYAEMLRHRLRRRLGIGPDEVLALGIGRADLRKGFDLFLQVWRAAARLRARRGASVHFAWVGDMDPAMRAYLAPEIAAAEAGGRFHLPGATGQPGEWFCAADIHLGIR